MQNDVNNGAPLLQIEQLHKSYHGREVLKGITLTVRQGDSVVLIGPSGSGKSTLLRCINALEPIDSGKVLFRGQEVHHSGVALHRIRADIGMVFQSFDLFPHMTVLENIMLAPMKVRGLPREAVRERALELLRKVHIPEKAEFYPDQLSGGQQQRVAIARALAMSPKVMLFDEPTSALDPEMIKEVLDVMIELVEDGMTMVVVSHEMAFARRAASRVWFMDGGVVLEDTAAEQFFGGASHPRAQQFLQQILAY